MAAGCPGEVTPVSLVDFILARARGDGPGPFAVEHAIACHDAVGDDLQAYVCWDAHRARRQLADLRRRAGSLAGVPVSVKDLYGVAGWPVHAGMKRPLPSSWEREGPLVATLRRLDAVVMGKTHTVELAFGGLGTGAHWPVPRNPWDVTCHRVPGGSSAGAGVSLAEGSALLALGTDTAGSVRLPASFTGCVGVKTSPGRWPTDGIVPLSPSLDTAGVLARSVADARLGFVALDRAAAADRLADLANAQTPPPAGLRLARLETVLWDDLEPGIGEAVDGALRELERAGARLASRSLEEVRGALDLFLAGGPVAVELAAFLEHELPGRRAELDPNVASRLEGVETLPAQEYLGRLHRMRALRAAAASQLVAGEWLVAPTSAVTPPRLDELQAPQAYRSRNVAALRNTAVASYLGLCAVTFPAGLDAAGMPVGMQLIGPPGAEEALLEAAAAAECVLGTPQQRLGRPPRIPAHLEEGR